MSTSHHNQHKKLAPTDEPQHTLNIIGRETILNKSIVQEQKLLQQTSENNSTHINQQILLQSNQVKQQQHQQVLLDKTGGLPQQSLQIQLNQRLLPMGQHPQQQPNQSLSQHENHLQHQQSQLATSNETVQKLG